MADTAPRAPTAFAGYLGVFWGDVNTKKWLAALAAVAAVWLFTLVNIAGARETRWAQWPGSPE